MLSSYILSSKKVKSELIESWPEPTWFPNKYIDNSFTCVPASTVDFNSPSTYNSVAFLIYVCFEFKFVSCTPAYLLPWLEPI